MMTLTRHAYAKINLTLDVEARRADGYHDIASILQTIALHDTLTVTRTPDRPGVHLEVVGDESEGVPSDGSNLVHRAAVLLQEAAAVRGLLAAEESGLRVRLHKRIPSQAGLGGGSSDAAATLRAVNQLFGLKLSTNQLIEFAAALGSDVPFFLIGGSAVVYDVGVQVKLRKPLNPAWHLIVVKPPAAVSTAAAYAALDALPDRKAGSATYNATTGNNDLCLGNDFEAVILPTYPEIAAVHALLSQTDPADESFKPLLCGSGSCVFRRVADGGEAERLADSLRHADVGKVWTTTTIGALEVVDAVVLAGGRNNAEMEAATGVKNRALTPLGGRTMLDYVVSALRLSDFVENVFVVGDVPAGEGYQVVGGGGTMLDNLMAGLRAAQDAGARKHVLVSTSDIPFLTPESVDDFVRRAVADDADLCCPFVSLALCQERFPEMKRTAVKLREGEFTLGNLALVSPGVLLSNQDTIQSAYAARKSPLKMAGLLGFGLLARLVLAQSVSPRFLTVRALEKGVGRLLGEYSRAAGIRSDYPEIGADVDKPEDVIIARRTLGG